MGVRSWDQAGWCPSVQGEREAAIAKAVGNRLVARGVARALPCELRIARDELVSSRTMSTPAREGVYGGTRRGVAARMRAAVRNSPTFECMRR